MKKMLRMLCAGVSVFLVACSTVELVKPLPAHWSGNVEDYAGKWRLEEEVFFVQLEEDGTGVWGGLEWEEDAKSFVRGEGKIIFTQVNERTFVSLLSEKEEDDGVILCEVKSMDEYLLVWSADAVYFKELIVKGVLKGTYQQEEKQGVHVKLTDEPQTLLKKLRALPAHEGFDYKEPVILQRVR